MNEQSLEPSERMRHEIARAERVLALGERLVESKRREVGKLRSIGSDPVRRDAYLAEKDASDDVGD